MYIGFQRERRTGEHQTKNQQTDSNANIQRCEAIVVKLFLKTQLIMKMLIDKTRAKFFYLLITETNAVNIKTMEKIKCGKR